MLLPEPIQNLITAFSRLPGVGPKTASRLAFFLLRAPEDLSRDLAIALNELKSSITYCQNCYHITTTGRQFCDICSNDLRDKSQICVVEEPLDVLALERTGVYLGQYHVLHGALSPIEGIGPDDLKVRELIARVRSGEIREVILATNLSQQLASLGVKLTRLARGLPVGGDLEYADQSTLQRALSGRQEMS
jgi:recombination protein RecR